MISASPGAVTEVPTAAIFPSRNRTLPPRMVGPAAVRTVTLRMSVARDAGTTYVLGKGSALGAETAPAPGGNRVVSRAGAGAVAGRGCAAAVDFAGAHAASAATTPPMATDPTNRCLMS